MSKKKALLLVLLAMLLIFVGIWFFYPVPETATSVLLEGQTDVVPGVTLDEGVSPEDEISSEEYEEMIAKPKTLPNSITASFVGGLEDGTDIGEVSLSSDENGIYVYAVLDVSPAPVGYNYIGWIMGPEGIITPAGIFSEAPEGGLMTIAQTDTTADTETFTSFDVTQQLAGAEDIQKGEVLYKATFKAPGVVEDPVSVVDEVE